MTTLGRYEVLEEIGRGSMGRVYLGHDPFRDRSVALKIARRELLPANRGDQLFFNEMRIAGRLSHPNIVQIYDAGTEGNDYYIAMEYVADSHTLERHCRRDGLLPLVTVAEIIFKCAEALDYAHRKGVIHRDIKPANVLLRSDGMVKVTDFSVAVLVDPHVVDTQLMLPAGSPMYMSPEQVREESITHQSDLYSLGVVFYELLAGVHPFAGDSLARVAHRILNEEPPPLGRYREVPASLLAVIDRALAKSPAARYENALDFAADLSRLFSELHNPQDGIATEGRANLLKGLSFFRPFPEAEVWELLRWAHWQEFEPGHPIITEGERDDDFFIVVEGEVSVRKGGRPVATLGPGECVGEMAYLATQERSATVVALTQVTVLRMNAERIEQASESCQIEFQKVFIETLIQRLAQTTRALVEQTG